MIIIKTVDVLVVGMGPAGARAAEVAARAGCDVVALERGDLAGEPVQCAEFVPWLIGQEVTGVGHTTRQSITSMLTYVGNEIPDLSSELQGLMIDRGDFDRALIDRARQAGVACQFGCRVTGVDKDGCISTRTGEKFRPRVIVGADGPRSVIGKAIGHSNHHIVESRQIVVSLMQHQSSTRVWLSERFPGGYAWMFPKGEVANVGVGVAPPWKAWLKPELERLHFSLAREGAVGDSILGYTGGAIPVGGMVGPTAQVAGVAIFLAGDAAGLTHPITGAGIGPAIISGELAGRAAVAWLGQDPEAPSDYETEVGDLFGLSYDRAIAHRKRLMSFFDEGAAPRATEWRRSWIAYPEYWAN